jgi:ubiquinone/menaquinone biosynthesis C-methylase UbiE
MESSFLIPAKTLEAVHLTPGMMVADLGAGSGFFTRAAARMVTPGEVWAVDLSGDLLARIKNLSLAQGLSNVEVMRGDIEDIRGSNLPAGFFDFVIVSNVLFACEDRLAVAREVERIIKPTGRALIIDWRGSFDGMGPHEGHVFTAGAARDVFEQAGLYYLGDVPAGEYHWGFVVRKNVLQPAQ